MKMKRFITIVMLLSVFIMGGSAVYAQNTKVRTPGSTAKKKSTDSSRSSNSKKSLSVTDFLRKDTYGFSGFKSDSQIETALRKAGFTLTSKKVTKEELEVGTAGDKYAPGKTTELVYSKNGTRVEWTSYCYDYAPKEDYKDAIFITFSDSASKNTFVSNIKANGFYKEFDYFRDRGSLIHVETNGNKITLYGNWG